jgi:hypothetical protein
MPSTPSLNEYLSFEPIFDPCYFSLDNTLNMIITFHCRKRRGREKGKETEGKRQKGRDTEEETEGKRHKRNGKKETEGNS